MQDLDIRGSGNLLGGEQSGFIADVGFETYQRILNEALFELRDSEFKDQSAPEEKSVITNTKRHAKPYIQDFQIDTDLEIMFPDEYISNISERIRLYKELNEIESDEAYHFSKRSLPTGSGKYPLLLKLW